MRTSCFCGLKARCLAFADWKCVCYDDFYVIIQTELLFLLKNISIQQSSQLRTTGSTFLSGFCWVERCRAPNSVRLGESTGARACCVWRSVWRLTSGRQVRHRTFARSSWMLIHPKIPATSFWLASAAKAIRKQNKIKDPFRGSARNLTSFPGGAGPCENPFN